MTTDTPAAAKFGDETAPISVSAWVALAILTGMYIANNIDRSVMSVLAVPVREDFNLSDSQIGILTGLAFSLTYALAGIPIGYLIDRVNRRNLLAALMTIWSASTAACGLAPNYWTLVTARFAVGAAEAGGAPTAMSMISDLFPPNRRSLAISIFWSSTAFGTATSFIFGAIIAVHFGWRAAFFIAGLPGIVLAVLLILVVREPRRGAFDTNEAETEPAPSLAEAWRLARITPGVVHGFLGVSLSSLMLSSIVIWSVSFFVRVHQMDLAQAGLYVGLSVAVFGAAGSLLGGVIGDFAFKKWGMPGLLLVPVITTLIAAVCGIAMALSFNPFMGLAAFMGFELMSRSYTAPGYNFVLTAMPPRTRGIVVSTLQGITNLVGYGLGPVSVGFISDMIEGDQSLRYGLLAVSCIGFWVSGHFYLGYRAVSRAERLSDGLPSSKAG